MLAHHHISAEAHSTVRQCHRRVWLGQPSRTRPRRNTAHAISMTPSRWSVCSARGGSLLGSHILCLKKKYVKTGTKQRYCLCSIILKNCAPKLETATPIKEKRAAPKLNANSAEWWKSILFLFYRGIKTEDEQVIQVVIIAEQQVINIFAA